jgi:hypothetical protein
MWSARELAALSSLQAQALSLGGNASMKSGPDIRGYPEFRVLRCRVDLRRNPLCTLRVAAIFQVATDSQLAQSLLQIKFQ